ncbi:putative membrane protein [Stakelama sediminis]|uniref:Putative membrane protein n=2 Tax=Stakelama sediminis TaxID=463200 RepID=A0A840Z380_9SPHN|nr:putative membrane protein [Stakelama sediminis]
MASALAIALANVSSAFAAETVTYTYDAQGRLVVVEHSGAVNNNVKTEYSHDKADNRTNVKITGVSSTSGGGSGSGGGSLPPGGGPGLDPGTPGTGGNCTQTELGMVCPR